jgi:hypothetical protein
VFLGLHAQSQVNYCDSVLVSLNQIDTTTSPDLIYFDVQVFGYSPNVGYPGFVLLNSIGDTIAYENFNTVLNVFTIMPNTTETRFLKVVQNFSLPFIGTLHLRIVGLLEIQLLHVSFHLTLVLSQLISMR